MATYTITNLAELQAMSSHLADDCVLANNIDASATETDTGTYPNGFVPIGTLANNFTGTFDGGGFSITGLYINNAALTYAGLFGYVNRGASAGGFIKDLTLEVEIVGSTPCGSLAGYAAASAVENLVISDCVVSGTVSSASTSVGGFIGSVSAVTITDCSSSVNVTKSSGAGSVGQLAGFIGKVVGSVISGCSSTGTLTFSGSAGTAIQMVGGFVGDTTSGTTTITDCYSTSNIICTLTGGTSTILKIGGFIGVGTTGATVTTCYATGSITSTYDKTSYLGGFIGENAINVTKCAAVGNILSPNATTLYAGGFFGVCAASTVSNCYAKGDVCSSGIAISNASLGGFTGYYSGASTTTNCYSTGFVYQSTTKGGGFSGDGLSAPSLVTCYYDKETSGWTTSDGGANAANGKTTAEMQTQATYSGWDFTTIWDNNVTTQSAIIGSNITLWASKTNDYDNFKVGDKDDDAIENEIPTQNEIRFVAGLESLIIGTAGDEWKLGSNKLATPITPTNITIKQQSEYGSSMIQPVKINSAILFVDIVARKLREAAYDSNSEKFLSPDLTALAEHITKTGITTIARQKNPDSILWCTLTDGTLLSFTYERDQNVLAWAKHPLGGDGFCQSVCVLPGATEDVVYISVYRTKVGSAVTRDGETITRDGETVYWGESENVFIEKIMPRTFNTISDCFFVDCGITATRATATSIVTGLDHLEGETVKLLVDGVEADEDVVENGQVTVSFAGVASVTWTKAHVGLAYTSLLQPLRIVVGDSHGSITKVPELNASFLDTGAAFYGNDASDVKAIDFTQIGLINTSDITGLYTGQVKLTMAGQFSVENPIYISSDKPLPLCVRALMCRIEKTGR